jgi:hypothetical protein
MIRSYSFSTDNDKEEDCLVKVRKLICGRIRYSSHLCMRPVMAILGCQLNYIWNELQSRIGGLTSDPNLEAGRLVSDLDLGMENLKLRAKRGSTRFQ